MRLQFQPYDHQQHYQRKFRRRDCLHLRFQRNYHRQHSKRQFGHLWRGICCVEVFNLTISNNTVSGNSASGGFWTGGSGGGIYCYASSPTISNNTVSGNSASGGSLTGGFGGGIYCNNNSSPTISNNIISENSAILDGGGSPAISIPAQHQRQHISANSADSSGGGISCLESANPTLINCILWAIAPADLLGIWR